MTTCTYHHRLLIFSFPGATMTDVLIFQVAHSRKYLHKRALSPAKENLTRRYGMLA